LGGKSGKGAFLVVAIFLSTPSFPSFLQAQAQLTLGILILAAVGLSVYAVRRLPK